MTAAFINPSSFSYESAGFTDDNANVYQTPTNPSFEVWTNSSGDIESWNITIRGEELIIMSVWAPQAGVSELRRRLHCSWGAAALRV